MNKTLKISLISLGVLGTGIGIYALLRRRRKGSSNTVTYDNNMVADGDNHNWPIQRGFDKYYGMLSGGGGYFEPNTLTKDNERIAPPEGFYLTEEINNATIEMMEDHFESKKDTPFFFYVAHYAPHRPLHALENDIKKHKGK